MDKYNAFGVSKQVAWAEMQLLKMEEDFNFSIEQFGHDYAVGLFAKKRQTYERITCIKQSLERLEKLLANLNTLSPDLFSKLSEKEFSQEGVLETIVKSLSAQKI